MASKHKLTNSNVKSKVKNKLGVYKLYNSRSGPVKYVGMSKEIADRLKSYTGKYSFFEFEYQPNETEAYEREANLYHHYGGKDKLDNENHPPRPHERVVCPACKIHE